MKTLKRILISVSVAAITFFVTLIFFLLISDDNPPDSFFILLMISLIGFPIIAYVFTLKKLSKPLTTDMLSNNLQMSSGNRPILNITMTGKLQLVGGLGELPEGSNCKVKYNSEKIVFHVSGQEFTLDASKMLDVSIMTSTEIQQQYVSSIGGAVAGALLLGPLGAIIGGSASKKKITNKRKYLIFTYISTDETKYIVFDVTHNLGTGNNIKSTYRYLKKNEKVKIDL